MTFTGRGAGVGVDIVRKTREGLQSWESNARPAATFRSEAIPGTHPNEQNSLRLSYSCINVTPRSAAGTTSWTVWASADML